MGASGPAPVRPPAAPQLHQVHLRSSRHGGVSRSPKPGHPSHAPRAPHIALPGSRPFLAGTGAQEALVEK